MGRGLSELQKAILKLSWEEYQIHHNAFKDKALVARWQAWDHDNFKRYLLPDSEKPTPPNEFKPFIEDNWQGFAWITDIFVRYYHWPVKSTRQGRSKFSKSEIGIKPYMAAYIAVRKALTRLQARKLIFITKNQSSYALTSEGHDLMDKLSRPAAKDEVVELRYLRDIGNSQDGGVWHPKGEIIQVDSENARRMLTTDIWEVVTPIG